MSVRFEKTIHFIIYLSYLKLIIINFKWYLEIKYNICIIRQKEIKQN